MSRGPWGMQGDRARGFIGAEAIAHEDFVSLGGEQAGKMRSEGKAYRVADGDVPHFLFNA